MAVNAGEPEVTVSETKELRLMVRKLERFKGRRRWRWRPSKIQPGLPAEKTTLAGSPVGEGLHPVKWIAEARGFSRKHQYKMRSGFG